MKEDVTDVLLNLKDIVFRCYSDEPVTIRLDVRGPKVVRAEDFVVSSDVEIINPDLQIATLSAKGRLALDAVVERGKGYASAEKNKRTSTIGIIPIDSIFSPVRRVAVDVEPTRVGQATDYDMLVIDVETDGSISPREAIASAGETLRNLTALIAEISDAAQGLELSEAEEIEEHSPDLDLAIEELELTERPRNCLKRAQINTIGELIGRTPEDLLSITNFGQKSLDEVVEKLEGRGLSLRSKD
jgi:DNA-directed RNA polymerase subunit alpha